jgi:hypothetical protein
MVRYTLRTEQRVNLGPGSQEMERAAKQKGAAGVARQIAAHEQYSKPQTNPG